MKTTEWFKCSLLELELKIIIYYGNTYWVLWTRTMRSIHLISLMAPRQPKKDTMATRAPEAIRM